MTLKLIHALTRLAQANDEAAARAPPKLVAILQATAQSADEAARHVQFNRLDQLTAKQRELVTQCSEEPP